MVLRQSIYCNLSRTVCLCVVENGIDPPPVLLSIGLAWCSRLLQCSCKSSLDIFCRSYDDKHCTFLDCGRATYVALFHIWPTPSYQSYNTITSIASCDKHTLLYPLRLKFFFSVYQHTSFLVRASTVINDGPESPEPCTYSLGAKERPPARFDYATAACPEQATLSFRK